MNIRPAVFLDRDGVINLLVDRGGVLTSPRNEREFNYVDGVDRFVETAMGLGFEVVVISNQPEVKRGLVERRTVEEFHQRIRREIGIQHFYVCWHDETDNCECRKPKPGLLIKAALELKLDLSRSFFVGDREKDMIAARAAGCRGLLLAGGPIRDTLQFQNWKSVCEFIKNVVAKNQLHCSPDSSSTACSRREQVDSNSESQGGPIKRSD